MTRGQTVLRIVAKLRSERLRKSRWKLDASLSDMRRRGELVALGESQMLCWMDELRGRPCATERGRQLRKEIRALVRVQAAGGEASMGVGARLKELRAELDECMYVRDYVLVEMESKRDFERLCAQGFELNDNHMCFLIATTGGVKTSTMIFVSEDILGELRRRLNNGRDEERAFVPAKLEAYMALACSASHPVSDPGGVLVVRDCVNHFREDAIHISDEAGGEPELQFQKDSEIELIDSDGYGLMSPELAARWGAELNEAGPLPGCNTRCAFEKGMVFPFDFKRFAREVAGVSTVTDVWGQERRVEDIELVLTTSMLKLWDSYSSWDEYWHNCQQNGYTFRVTKTCPQKLEGERATNYQFLQGYELTDEELERFIAPTIEAIREAMCGDWAHTLTYIKGQVSPDSISSMPDDWSKALMIEPLMMDDPYVRSRVRAMLRRRVDDAKIGVIDVHGNYAMISGDPYALCQSMFGLEVTGLLKATECYSRYWGDCGATEVVAFRAPMSAANNIRVLRVSDTPEKRDWYRHMTTVLILNGWDATRHATNGADCDGDMYMTTDDPLLLRHAPRLPVIMCQQRQGVKFKVDWADFAKCNMDAAGDDIGAITNRITAMYDKLTLVEDAVSKNTLKYRIQCGQLYQQNAIDKAKGIVANPMPAEWYDMHALRFAEGDTPEDSARKLCNLKLAVNRKSYFMRYVYADVMSTWRAFMNRSRNSALRRFGMTLEDLQALVAGGGGDEEQREFMSDYHKYMPVSDGKCLVNRICHMIEDTFAIRDAAPSEFDPAILKSGAPYDPRQLERLREIYRGYAGDCRSMQREAARSRTSAEDVQQMRSALMDYYRARCREVCPDERALCDALIDMCYGGGGKRQFAWDVCGTQIIYNLLERSGGRICYPARSGQGDVVFRGERYEIRSVEVC